MIDNQLKFVTLHSREDLLKESAKFLNKEWPRSDGSREYSQTKSCRNEPPMSFLLIKQDTDEIVGHARICCLPARPEALWIESVMIKKEERGKKLGKKLMEMVEKWMIDNGYKQAYLSTDDQVEFYKRCGYEECQPIVHSTTSTSVFPAMQKFHLNAALDSINSSNNSTSRAISSTNYNVPPPPPPPPILCQSAGTQTPDVIMQFMRKYL